MFSSLFFLVFWFSNLLLLHYHLPSFICMPFLLFLPTHYLCLFLIRPCSRFFFIFATCLLLPRSFFHLCHCTISFFHFPFLPYIVAIDSYYFSLNPSLSCLVILLLLLLHFPISLTFFFPIIIYWSAVFLTCLASQHYSVFPYLIVSFSFSSLCLYCLFICFSCLFLLLIFCYFLLSVPYSSILIHPGCCPLALLRLSLYPLYPSFSCFLLICSLLPLLH